MTTRKAAVAGQFYPESESELRKAINGLLNKDTTEKLTARAIIAPHAGYIYSGQVAGDVYSSVHIPRNIILIGPNHTGLGERVAVSGVDSWTTPLGDVHVNSELRAALIQGSELCVLDNAAHEEEHSLEVQLPFIQVLNAEASIVPVTLAGLGIKDCEALGKSIAKVIKDFNKDVLIVVSSDMNHFDSDEVTRSKDKLAIEKVLSLDAPGLLSICATEDITMCGVIPSAVAIFAALELGAKEASLVSHDTSATASNDYDRTVGYAGFVI
jgi:hypothetical protein